MSSEASSPQLVAYTYDLFHRRLSRALDTGRNVAGREVDGRAADVPELDRRGGRCQAFREAPLCQCVARKRTTMWGLKAESNCIPSEGWESASARDL